MRWSRLGCVLLVLSGCSDAEQPRSLTVPERPACSEGAGDLYVLTREGRVYTFDPPSREFTKVADKLSCWAPGMVLNSMAVDRTGVLWLNFVEWALEEELLGGALYRASTLDGTCVRTDVALPSAWSKLGLTFAASSPSDSTEALFAVASPVGAHCLLPPEQPGAGLARLEPQNTASLTSIGPFPDGLDRVNAEITSAPNGELFGLFGKQTPVLARIDKATGALSDVVTLDGLECPNTLAFAPWGGELYLFTAPAFDVNSSVARYSLADGTLELGYVSNVGANIIGAAVSTCLGEPG